MTTIYEDDFTKVVINKTTNEVFVSSKNLKEVHSTSNVETVRISTRNKIHISISEGGSNFIHRGVRGLDTVSIK